MTTTAVDQNDFHAAMMAPDMPVPAGLTDGAGRPAGRRFDVYRNNVALGLTEALESAFPVVRRIVGDGFFRAMSAVFLRSHPPTSPVMMFYGDAMPGFLKAFEPVRHLAYLPDVARLECAIRVSYHAEDATPLGPDALARVAPDALMRVRLRFAPSATLLGSRHPVYSIWQANQPGHVPGHILPEKQSVLITRPQFDPVVEPLALPAARFVDTLRTGGTFGAAVAAGGPDLDLASTLALLLARGALVGIHAS